MKNFEKARREMVELLRSRGIDNERVLAAMEAVPRHRFIPEPLRGADAYGDHPCLIGFGQTISQPYIVAYMTQALAVQPGEKVLEVGGGCGYQAAVLAELGAEVYTVEIVPELAAHTRAVLADLGIAGVQVCCGDGYKGLPECAPFDAVLAACAPLEVPPALIDQLAGGGRMILPVGGRSQHLVRLCKRGGSIVRHEDLPVRFVPMVFGGDAE